MFSGGLRRANGLATAPAGSGLRLDGSARGQRPPRRTRAWQIYLTPSARSCAHDWMSCVRWCANTDAFTRPKPALVDGFAAATRVGQPQRCGSQARRGRSRRVGSRRRSSVSAEREAKREKVLALVCERPGITKAELKAAAGFSTAGVAQNLRRMLDRGEVREDALPGRCDRVLDRRRRRSRPVSQPPVRPTPVPRRCAWAGVATRWRTRVWARRQQLGVP